MKCIMKVTLLQDLDKSSPPNAFLVMYSVVDKASFLRAESDLTRLSEAELLRTRPAILVGNKVDLARSKAVSTQGKILLHCARKINKNVKVLIYNTTTYFSNVHILF